MRSPIFVDEHAVRLEDESRLTLPAEIVKVLPPEQADDGWFAMIGPDGRLWLYPEQTFGALKHREMAATRIEMDREQRVVLPQALVARARLKGELTLVGVADHLELWNQPEWLEYRRALTDRFIRNHR